MPRKTFVAGEILTASDVNTNLMDQAVMVFNDATDRATAIPTPVEGMVTYLKDANQVQAFTGSAFTPVGGILQVVSATKTDTATTTSTTFGDVSDLSVSITPSSASSKVYVVAQVGGGASESAGLLLRLRRDSTDIYLGDAADSRTRVSSVLYPGTGAGATSNLSSTIVFFDSPSTTSATTYKIQFASSATGNLVAVNRGVLDGDAATVTRSVSSITVMEVAG